MATNSNLPTWMQDDWQISTTDQNSYGAVVSDVLSFVGTDVMLEHNFMPTTRSSSSTSTTSWSQRWGTFDPNSATPTSISGSTYPDQKQFIIVYDGTNLTCTMAAPPSSTGSIVIGALFGALAGAAVGFIAGAPLRGFLTGLLSGSTASLVTAFRIQSNNQTAGGSVVWTAADGGSSRIIKPEPHHSLKSVGA